MSEVGRVSLYQALKNFRKKDAVSFHIPGHKFGRGLSRDFRRHGFSIDVTEFSETDDLQNPIGILDQAQRHAAEAFGAGRSFFLTNGSSSGIQAGVLACCKSGDRLLVDRTCHRSVLEGLLLIGAEPVFLSPAFDGSLGVYTGITEDMVEKALAENPDVVGLVVTCPTYYGVCAPLREIGEILHKKGKFLMVDEAHGPHLSFGEGLPSPALEQGADLCVQSTHKTLSALGQTALLHLGKEGLIPQEAVEESLAVLRTTSPSYLLMASMDEAILQMEKRGKAVIANLIREIGVLKQDLESRTPIRFLDERAHHMGQDGLRLAVDVRGLGVSGYEAAEILKQKNGIYPEMADDGYVVCVVTVGNTPKEIRALKSALLALARDPDKAVTGQGERPLPEILMKRSVREAWLCEKERVSVKACVGRISGEIVAICPPGAPILVPGQEITPQVAERLLQNEIDTVLVISKETV